MNRNELNALVLNDKEVEGLARLIVARRLSDSENWLQWEDYPQLAEDVFRRVCGNVSRHAEENLRWRSGYYDRSRNVDSQSVLEATQ